jgi:RNA polymerase sigma-70 factor (ECF subfamily)
LQPSDQHIIEEIRAGNTRRYALLVDRYKSQSMTLAARMVGDRHEAEELVQDAFLRAFRSLEKFRGEAKFSTWLYRIVYNVCATRISRRKPKPWQLEIEDGRQQDNLLADVESMTAQERMEEDELQQAVDSAIDALPEKFKLVVTMFYVQEMSYEEIGSVLNQPLGTVKANLFRGRNLLREQMRSALKGEMKVA